MNFNLIFIFEVIFIIIKKFFDNYKYFLFIYKKKIYFN